MFGAAWHERGVNGWADAVLLTASLLQIVTIIGQAFKCTYRELPFPAVSFIPTVNCLGRTRLTCSFIERCSSRPKRGCPANVRHPLPVSWAICTVSYETCATRGLVEFITALPRTQACANKMTETYVWSKISSGFPYDVDTISFASQSPV